MGAEDAQAAHRASRKSVAFTEEKLIVDADGSVTMVASPTDDLKETAMSHTPPQSDEIPPEEGDGVDALPLKKKKKAKKIDEDDAEAAEAADAMDEAGVDTPAADGDEPVLDLGLKKKKKKVKKAADGEEDSFAAKLQALDLDKEGGEETGAKEDQTGDMNEGTGVWEHNETKPIVYSLLLGRFFSLLSQKNPDHASGGARSYKIPPPQCMREGNKKTIFVNLPEICKRMSRSEEHVTAFIFTELGTSGSVDGSRRLVIKGRFQSKQLENVLRKYILDYVTCKTCRSPETSLSKGENRLYFITCNSCGSRRSVQAIKTGFSAQVGKRRKMKV
ncbi:hypothetical protein P8C59_004746 [Phyllachora maydis]|uniref:Translation initiation factor IF2/IF5 domain-containing protein n=1 Tax=Phyllachora maydis TaxID=1825666 RepID=A0AAD9I2Y9_9PEZI|nr:hypothetical protein P8C59_004746 [Phyllachora maydis]